MSKIAHKLVALNFKCTSLLTTWWEAKWCKTYDGDIEKAHDRLFGQIFFKSFPKKEEFDSWKKTINQKNQLLLIGKPLCYLSPFFFFTSYFYSLCFVNPFLFFILQLKATLMKWMLGKKKRLLTPWSFKRLL